MTAPIFPALVASFLDNLLPSARYIAICDELAKDAEISCAGTELLADRVSTCTAARMSFLKRLGVEVSDKEIEAMTAARVVSGMKRSVWQFAPVIVCELQMTTC